MTELTVQPTVDGIRVGEPPPHPEVTGIVEARGGLLLSDELSEATHPAAMLWDPDLAADWLWEVYGATAGARILAGAASVTPDPDAPGLADVRRLAHLRWADHWWPASLIAGVPDLPEAVLRAEITVATAAVEHLLDDDTAVERALDTVNLGELESFGPNGSLDELVETITGLADDYGVAPATAAPAPDPTQWTLAAGDGPSGIGVVLRSGTTGIVWTLLRPRQLDAAATAEWALTRASGQTRMSVSVPAAPGPWRDRGRLRARLGDDEISLDRPPTAVGYAGSGPVSDTVLRLPAARRHLLVYSPDLVNPNTVDVPEPGAAARQAALIARARARLTASGACLAERIAAQDAP